MTTITTQEFDNLARFIVQAAGIQLEKGKEYLMEARLEPILERYGCDSFNDLYYQAIADGTGKLKASIIDAITINETYFFRDTTPFELLKHKIIPDLIDQKTATYGQRKLPLKIWSAACSIGQEVYSIGMTLKEMHLESDRFEISILGTDISNEAIARASYGKYNQFEIERGLGTFYLNKYFAKVANGWRINDEIRSLARFTQLDLNQSLSNLGKFDIIFCRNVAIYFPMNGKIKLFQNLAGALNPGGVLIVGGSESLAGLANDFVPRHYLNGVFYQLRKSEPARSQVPELSPYRQAAPLPREHSLQTASRPKPEPDLPPKPSPSATNQRLADLQKKLAESQVIQEELKENLAIQSNRQGTPLDTPPAKSGANQPQAIKPEKASLLEKLRSKARTAGSPLLADQAEQKSKPDSLLEKLKEKEKEQP